MNKYYYQLTGRPHSGLQNPEKYGLTYEQVVMLIEADKWREYYSWWKARTKKLEEIKSEDYVSKRIRTRITQRVKRKRVQKLRCSLCRKLYPKGTPYVRVTESVKFCASCVRKIEEM